MGYRNTLNLLKTYNDMTVPERAEFLRKNADKIGAKFGYKHGLDGNKYYAFLSIPEKEQLEYLNNLSRNQLFVSTYGENKFKSMNKRQRDEFMERDIIDTALKEKFGDDPNYLYYNQTLSTEGKKSLVSRVPTLQEINEAVERKKNGNHTFFDKVEELNTKVSAILGYPLGMVGSETDHYKKLKLIGTEELAKEIERILREDRERRFNLALKLVPLIEQYYRQMLASGEISARDIDNEFNLVVKDNRYYKAYRETLESYGGDMFNSKGGSGLSNKIKMLSTLAALSSLGGAASAYDFLDGQMEEMVSNAQGPGGRALNTLKGVFTGTVAAIGQVLAALGNIGVRAVGGEKGLTEWLNKQYDPDKDPFYERFFNNKYWNDVDKYGTFDTADHVRADSLGGLAEGVNVYDPSSKGDIFSEESLHSIVGMSKFLLSLALMNYVSGGTAGAFAKIGGKAGTILSRAASTAGLLSGSASIGNAYAYGVFEETKQKLMQDLSNRTEMKVEADADEMSKSQQFLNSVDAKARQLKLYSEYANTSLDDLKALISMHDLSEYKDAKREEYQNSNDYKLDEEAINSAATDAFVTSVTLEAIKYLPFNAGVRTWLQSPTQRAILDKWFKRTPPSKYNIKGELMGFENTKGVVTNTAKFKEISKPVLKNIFYGGFTNYTDETASGFAVGLGLSNYNDYVKLKLNPEEYSKSLSPYYGVMAELNGPINEAMSRSMQKLALIAFLVGAGGSLFGPSFTGAKERAQAKKLAYKMDSETGEITQNTTLRYNFWDKIGNAPIVLSPALKQIALARTDFRAREQHVKNVNSIIKGFRDDLDKDIQSSNLLGNLEKNVEVGTPEGVLAAQSLSVFDLATRINTARTNTEVGNSPIVLKTMEEIKRLAESPDAVTDEDVIKGLFAPSVTHNNQSDAIAVLEQATQDSREAEQSPDGTQQVSESVQLSEEQKAEAKLNIHLKAKALLDYANRVQLIRKSIEQQVRGRLLTDPYAEETIDVITGIAFLKEFLENQLKELLGVENVNTSHDPNNTIKSKKHFNARYKAVSEYIQQLKLSQENLEKELKVKGDIDLGIVLEGFSAKEARQFRKIMLKSQLQKVKRLKEIAEREMGILDTIKPKFENADILTEASAEDISRMSPIEQWEFLNPENAGNYSEKLKSVIDGIVTAVDYNPVVAETASNLAKMINNNNEALSIMKKSPEAVSSYKSYIKQYRDTMLKEEFYNTALLQMTEHYMTFSGQEIENSLKEMSNVRFTQKVASWLKEANHKDFPTQQSVDDMVARISPIIELNQKMRGLLTHGIINANGEATPIMNSEGNPLNSLDKILVEAALNKIAITSNNAEEFLEKMRTSDKDESELRKLRDALNTLIEEIKNEKDNVGKYDLVDNRSVISAINLLFESYSREQNGVEEVSLEELDSQEDKSALQLPGEQLNPQPVTPLFGIPLLVIPEDSPIYDALRNEGVSEDIIDLIKQSNPTSLDLLIEKAISLTTDATLKLKLLGLKVPVKAQVQSPVAQPSQPGKSEVTTMNITEELNKGTYSSNDVLTKILHTIVKNFKGKNPLSKFTKLQIVYHEEASLKLKELLGDRYNHNKDSVYVIQTEDGIIVGVLPFGNTAGDDVFSAIRNKGTDDTSKPVNWKIDPINESAISTISADLGKPNIEENKNTIKTILDNTVSLGRTLEEKISKFLGKIKSSKTEKGYPILEYLMDNGAHSYLFVDSLLDTKNSEGKTLREFIKNGGKFSDFNKTTKLAAQRFINIIKSDAITLEDIHNALYSGKNRIFGSTPSDSYIFNISANLNVIGEPNNLTFTLDINGDGSDVITLYEGFNKSTTDAGEVFNALMKNMLLDQNGDDRKITQEVEDLNHKRQTKEYTLIRWQVPYSSMNNAGTVGNTIDTIVALTIVEDNLISMYASTLDIDSAGGLHITVETPDALTMQLLRVNNLANVQTSMETLGSTSDSNALRLINSIEENSKKIHLSEDETHYTFDGRKEANGDNTIFHRITQVIQKAADRETPLMIAGSGIGNQVDSLYRDVATGKIFSAEELRTIGNSTNMLETARALAREKVTSIDSTQYPNISRNSSDDHSESDLVNLLTDAAIFIGCKLAQGNIVMGYGVKVAGTITDSLGNNINIGGTIDLLFYNPATKRFSLYDMKTTRDISKDPLKNMEKWTRQLKLYSVLLNQMYEIELEDAGIISMETKYSVDSDTLINIDKNTGEVTINNGESLIYQVTPYKLNELLFLGQYMLTELNNMTNTDALQKESVWNLIAKSSEAAEVNVKEMPTDTLIQSYFSYNPEGERKITVGNTVFTGETGELIYNKIRSEILLRNSPVNASQPAAPIKKGSVRMAREAAKLRGMAVNSEQVQTQQYTYDKLKNNPEYKLLVDFLNRKYGNEAESTWDEVAHLIGKDLLEEINKNCL